MRSQIIIHSRAEKLHYEIREIVAVAKAVEGLGQEITWENIGDPVKKGEKTPAWIKSIVKRAAGENETYAYAPTKGLEETRKFIAKRVNRRKGVQITAEDICFFNGLGDAVGKIYGILDPTVRVIGPSPAYSTHSSAEAAHTGSPHLTYKLDPKNNWYPDLEDLENKVKYNPNISGILYINPNNPTGAVYSKECLENIVRIAKKYDLFIIADEIYENLVYSKNKFTRLSDIIDHVPGIAMKGISKEIPWPGSRCGWLEFYNEGNGKKDHVFTKYVKAIVDSKMLEVSSTTLPQYVIPEIFSDKRYTQYRREVNSFYKSRAKLATDILKNIPGVNVVRPEGAFYLTVVFDKSILNKEQSLLIKNKDIRKFIRSKLDDSLELDKRFVYNLLGATGICVVPLTGFETKELGFRTTLLESNEKKFRWIFETLRQSIIDYTQK